MGNEFDYHRYWNNRLSGSFGLEAVGYIGLGKNFNQWMYRLRMKNFIRSVRKLDVPCSEMEVLDVGSGTGFYISLWEDLKVRAITGIDISEQAIKNLTIRFPNVKFYLQDVTKSLDGGKKYNIISCMDVLFHVVDDDSFEKAIHNLSDCLVSGGYLILTDNFVHRPTKREEHHVSRSLSEYVRIISNADLRIISRKPVFFFLNYPIDGNFYLLNLLWKFFLRFIPGNERLGYLMGCLFYPADLVLAQLFSEGPSTEIMICKKP